MTISTLTIMIALLSPWAHGASTPRCGFARFDALTAGAERAVGFITRQRDFDPAFSIDLKSPFHSAALPNMKQKNEAILARRGQDIVRFAWAHDIFEDFPRFRRHPALKAFVDKGLGELSVSTDANICDALECTDYFDFTIQIAEEPVRRLFSARSNERARRDLWAVFGHEFGHFIYDNYLVSTSVYESLAVAYRKIGALKYHLVVDAIGMSLSSMSKDEYIQVLRDTDDGEGDIRQRLECLQRLR